MKPLELVQKYFQAMQAGPAAAETLFALFAEDAIYIEPFSGTSRCHEGKAAIEECLRGSWDNAPPDLVLEVDRIDVDGDVVRSEWTCSSPAFDANVKGLDICQVRAGKIARLEVKFR